ncbi:glycosyltransferase [Zeaxanthinibacter sp. PT1]|uniref:glycosyltransferase n=1 Tax=Zeaxanthinibacter TaxID=561554 RepID=UPI002349CD93|nr:glycosyltransferase [Zeaxanthinibacter sp. PT1]MDC6352773.1 glycosyltransferase [Zeaxanthinibacter sp. PT1]
MKEKQKLSVLNITLSSGGAEKVISLLLKELVKDYDVTLFLFYDVVHFPVPDKVNKVILSNSDPFTNMSLSLPLFVYRYNKELRKRNIKYAISFLAYPNLVNGLISMWNPEIKTIISERGFPSDNTTSKVSFYTAKMFYPLLYNRCDKLFSNSVFINQDLKENFGIKIPMEVIYNPIEMPLLISRDYNNSNQVLRIITAGTLNTRKNQEMIIKALHRVSFNFYFSILGEGPLKNHLIELIDSFGLQPKVKLEGKVKDVYNHLANNDLFILSSFTEGFPNALLEAMSAGLPCISTNCLSGPLELLNEGSEVEIGTGSFYQAKYGILINNNDVTALVSAMSFLKENPSRLSHYSKMSLARAQSFDLKTIYSQFREFVEN